MCLRVYVCARERAPLCVRVDVSVYCERVTICVSVKTVYVYNVRYALVPQSVKGFLSFASLTYKPTRHKILSKK
jgi:hypothetical protein